ncbi:MAG: hypothetical protein AB1806_00885 [Acidobacteriota bacterium]
MSRTRTILVSLTLAAALSGATPHVAPEPPQEPAARDGRGAKTLLQRAEEARQTGKVSEAIGLYKQIIETSPNEERAHIGLWVATNVTERNRLRAESPDAGSADPLSPAALALGRQVTAATNAAVAQYYRWLVTTRPNVTAYRYRLATAEHAAGAALRAELRTIVADDPTFAPAWAHLAHDMAATGDVEAERDCYARAAAAAPDNPLYAYDLLSTYKMRDPKEHRRLVEAFVARFPSSEMAAVALRDAAADAETEDDRVALLERAAKNPGAVPIELFALHARTDPGKAARLAAELLETARHAKEGAGADYVVGELTKAADFYGSIASGRKLLGEGKPADAVAAVEKASPPASAAPLTFPVTALRADAFLAQGKPAAAYDLLLADPVTFGDPDLTAAAINVGGRLGKPEAQVRREILSAVLGRAHQADDFEIEGLTGGRKKLSEFRGQLVLLNLWHPT